MGIFPAVTGTPVTKGGQVVLEPGAKTSGDMGLQTIGQKGVVMTDPPGTKKGLSK